MDAQATPQPRLVLDTDSSSVELGLAQAKDGIALTLGTEQTCDVVYAGEHTSRNHAFIEAHRGDFYLVDTSSNGTFVQTEDERVQYVHRDRVRLWGVGWISLGTPLHVKKPIMFREHLFQEAVGS